ncbi:MAG: hypothetical protein NTY64_15025 [Deltaproteobacteria bacterium]|nr:hypothetical protein [Deltaproteobacteria bacterium]
MGGLSRRVALVNGIRQEKGTDLVVVDSGDLFFRDVQDAKDERALKTAKLITRIYKKMGVSAMNVGHLDLVQGVEFLANEQLPVISANIRSSTGKNLVFPPYQIREFSGIRIGFFGLIRPDIYMNLPQTVQETITIGDPVQAARDVVGALRDRADVIILLSDLGFEQDKDLVSLVPGIHFILAGHERNATVHPHREGGTYIMQSWVQGMYVGDLRLTLEKPGLPFQDGGTPARLREQIHHLDRSIASLEETRKATPSPPPNIAAAILELSKQKKNLEMQEKGISPESYTKGNLFLWKLIPLEQSLPVDEEIQTWIKESGLEADEEERIILY